MIQFLMVSTDEPNAAIFQSRTASSTEDLQHVQYGQIREGAFGGVVHLRTLDNDCQDRVSAIRETGMTYIPA